MENFFVGVDIAKDKFDAVIVNDENQTRHRVFNNNSRGFNAFKRWLEKYTLIPKVCLEATGFYSEPLAEYLDHHQIFVCVENPYKVKQFAKMKLARNKNDSLDAKLIALYAKQEKDLRRFMPRSKEKKALRELLQLHDKLVGDCQQINLQYSTAQTPCAKRLMKETVQLLKEQIAQVEKQLQAIIEKDEELQHAIELLCTITGIAWRSACVILTYLPAIENFSNAKQVAAFAGVSPKQCQSGTFKGKTVMCKLGESRLRKALYMPALVAKNHNPHLKPFCERLEANGKRPKQIVGALMRKLLHIIYGMLKSNMPFNPELV